MSGAGISLFLGVSSPEQLRQLLHNCIDSFVGRISSPLPNISVEVDWSPEDYETARKFIQNIYKNVVSNTDYNIDNELSELGTENINCIKECYRIRKSEIQKAVASECFARMECPYVTDFDWKVKWVIGSSTLASLREPLLQIDLRTVKIDSDENKLKKAVQFEMNLAELDNFISEIERCLADFKN